MNRLFGRALRPFQQFAATESAGGVLLLVCTAIALTWANSPWSESYFHLWEYKLTIGIEPWALSKSLHHWINDGLMVVFFFLVGLEIKRELLVGELASMRKAALPIAGAIGGMVVPALLYVAINHDGPGAAGWAIPMATDIAFALGVLALLGPRIPIALKVFLAALAIVDDIGAVLVIAFFYSGELNVSSLGGSVAILAILLLCSRLNVRRTSVYATLGVALWLTVLSSGIHATIAGVLLAMMIPARTRINEDQFIERASAALGEFRSASGPETTVISNPRQQEALHAMDSAVSDVQAPLLRMEHDLHNTVAFGIMPLFALANAGVALGGGVLQTLDWAVVGGIMLGLLVGKSVGITALAWGATRSGMAAPMAGVGWRSIHGVAWLGGIGFTMSLFIAGLAFGEGSLLDSAKVGILAGSLVAGVVGGLLLHGAPLAGAPVLRPMAAEPDPAHPPRMEGAE